MVQEAEKLMLYDSIDSEVLQSYLEFQFTSLIFFSLKEAACSEQSARMTAMDAASKNAGKFGQKWSLDSLFFKVMRSSGLISFSPVQIQPCHEKTCLMRTTKEQISQGLNV